MFSLYVPFPLPLLSFQTDHNYLSRKNARSTSTPLTPNASHAERKLGNASRLEKLTRILFIYSRPEIMVALLSKVEAQYDIKITFSVETEPLGTGTPSPSFPPSLSPSLVLMCVVCVCVFVRM